MIWIDSISQLQYYNQPRGFPCYCENLIYPSDLLLQGYFPASIVATLGIQVYVYSADGTTQLQEVTTYFEYYFFFVGNVVYFNLRLKSFAPIMCAQECYILRVRVYETDGIGYLFDKYTERYCQASCCDIPRGVIFSQDPIPTGEPPLFDEPPITPATAPTTECGEPLLRLITWFECYDNFTGDYYGLPTTTISGTATFRFRKISNFVGKIGRMPREISIERSQNCTLQRIQSAAQYQLQGWQWFPPWKMTEIEHQLHAPTIWVNDYKTDEPYVFNGGTIFERANACVDLYKLVATLEKCPVRQIFGCNEPCEAYGMSFGLTESYEGGSFYDENRNLIATDYEGLLNWYRTRDGVTDVIDQLYNSPVTSPLCEDMFGMFTVIGTGYIPTFFYYDEILPGNRVYGIRVSDEDLQILCHDVSCPRPVVEEYYVESVECTTPNVTEYYVADVPSEDVTYADYGDWVTDTGSLTISEGTARFAIRTTNSEYPITSPWEKPYVTQVFAVIGEAARPEFDTVVNIDADTVVSIQTNGFVQYFGQVTEADLVNAIIDIDITYNL